MGEAIGRGKRSLITQAGVSELDLTPGAESAWIEVIQKMDAVYADLVHYQVELEQKNSALEEAQQFISSVLAAMTDVLIVCDTDGVVQQVNSALERLTGIPAEHFIGEPIQQLFDEESLDLVDAFPQKLGRESIIDCEVSLRCSDGQGTPLAMNCSTRYDYDGGVVGMVLIGRPIGELRRAYHELNRAHEQLKRTQQQLVQSEKMASLGRLVAGVAHELNNPISFVFGNMHALKRYGKNITTFLSAVDGEPCSEALLNERKRLKIDRILGDMNPLIDGTLEGAERVSDIVQDLRRYSGGQKEYKQAFDLPTQIRKALKWVVRASRVKPEVNYYLPEALSFYGRKGQVHQILVNLVQNALDAMQDAPEVVLTLHCEVEDGRVLIRVEDYGSGIPEVNLPHIFDPFFTSKPVGQGTGLGLYISYGLACDLGGDLRVENGQVGAIFTLELPLKVEEQSA